MFLCPLGSYLAAWLQGGRVILCLTFAGSSTLCSRVAAPVARIIISQCLLLRGLELHSHAHALHSSAFQIRCVSSLILANVLREVLNFCTSGDVLWGKKIKAEGEFLFGPNSTSLRKQADSEWCPPPPLPDSTTLRFSSHPWGRSHKVRCSVHFMDRNKTKCLLSGLGHCQQIRVSGELYPRSLTEARGAGDGAEPWVAVNTVVKAFAV